MLRDPAQRCRMAQAIAQGILLYMIESNWNIERSPDLIWQRWWSVIFVIISS